MSAMHIWSPDMTVVISSYRTVRLDSDNEPAGAVLISMKLVESEQGRETKSHAMSPMHRLSFLRDHAA